MSLYIYVSEQLFLRALFEDSKIVVTSGKFQQFYPSFNKKGDIQRFPFRIFQLSKFIFIEHTQNCLGVELVLLKSLVGL